MKTWDGDKPIIKTCHHQTLSCIIGVQPSQLLQISIFFKKNAKWLYVSTEGRINNQLEKYELSYSLSYGTILLNLQLAQTRWFRGQNVIFITFLTNFNFFKKLSDGCISRWRDR